MINFLVIVSEKFLKLEIDSQELETNKEFLGSLQFLQNYL